ncbi:MAG: hypothetical protein GY770_31045, partial [Aestuariibacter sp.]|nr:hypothetical protein [Aestuariibacter sp.]
MFYIKETQTSGGNLMKVRVEKISIIAAIVLPVFLQSCGSSDDDGAEVATAPTIPVTIQSNYLSQASNRIGDYSAKSTDTEYSQMVGTYNDNIVAYNELGEALAGTSGDAGSAAAWQANTTYAEAGNIVSYNDGTKYGEFINSWWTLGDTPSFIPDSGKPWKLLKRTDSGGSTLTVAQTVDSWLADAAYT